ncbi:MAG: hypothetical protein ABI680_00260 [Chthoniobacteraceae bacterium]
MNRYRLFFIALLLLLILAAVAWLTLHLASTRERARNGATGVADRAARVFKPDTSPPRFSRE